MTNKMNATIFVTIILFLCCLTPAVCADDTVWTVSPAREYSYESDMSIAIVYDFLMNEMSFNRAVSSGIIANMIAESGIRTTALGDGGTSYGLCQWHNSRWDSLIKYAEINKVPMEDIDLQLHFFKDELTIEYAEAFQKISQLPDNENGAYQAAYIICTDYENPAGGETSAVGRGNIGINTLKKGIPEYHYNSTIMKILYMLSIYSSNYTPPIVRINGAAVMPAATDTYIADYSDSFMTYDEKYWQLTEKGEPDQSIQPWVQLEDLDSVDVRSQIWHLESLPDQENMEEDSNPFEETSDFPL